MKILLIELRDDRMGLGPQHLNSLMLPILAVWAERAGWEAEVQFRGFPDVEYSSCDVVALSLYTYLAPLGYKVAERFRAKGAIVIIGGPHAKGCSEEAAEHADLVFDRCDQNAWTSTLLKIEQGVIRAGQDQGQFVPSAEMVSVPAYTEIKPFYGDKIPLLLSSLGCPHDCDFCADWDSKYIKRDIDDVLEDVKNIEASFFVFCDPNFGVNRPFTSELLRRMIPLKKRYLMETSLVWLMDEGYLELLRDSGCLGIEIGVESLVRSYKKNGRSKSESALEETIVKIDFVKKYIPGVQVNMLLGHDEDTVKSFHAVADLYRRSKIDTLVPFVLTPLPGTPLFDRMKQEERIFEEDWNYFNCGYLTFEPRNLGIGDFYDHFIRLEKALHSPGIVARKIFACLRSHRSSRLRAILSAFLLYRAKNARFDHIPRLKKARDRALQKTRMPQEVDLLPKNWTVQN
jgi:radical SAM superfamily enzyme YgiQ (UPF0313 family)